MLTISNPIRPDQFDYYTGLAQHDYYHGPDAQPGKWIGQGCQALGLTGEVKPDQFQRLLAGFSPSDANLSLVQNAGDADRQGGIDMTFSAPKPFSVVWALVPELRRELENAHWGAVQVAFAKTEENYGYTRRGKGGLYLERTKLIAAAFDHKTSRDLDMQVHTHVVLLAISIRADGTTGTTYTKEIFRHKMELGAEYQKELINRVIELGFQVELRDKSFVIVGVDPKIVSVFSKRNHAIKAQLKKLGLSGAVAAKIAALDTRTAKRNVPLSELTVQWQKVAKELGWTEQTLEHIRQIPNQEHASTKAQSSARDTLTGPSQEHGVPSTDPSVKRQPEDVRKGEPASGNSVLQGSGTSEKTGTHSNESTVEGEDVRRIKSRAKARRNRSRRTGRGRKPTRRTSRKKRRARLNVKLARVRPFAKAPSWNPFSRLSVRYFKMYWHEGSVLKEAQKAKLKSLLNKKGSKVAIAGKTTGRSLERFVRETKDFFKDQGHQVIVVTRDRTKARALRKHLDVKTLSAFSLLSELKAERFSFSLGTKRLFPKALAINPFAEVRVPVVKFNHSPLRLTSNTVLVVSEAQKLWGRHIIRLVYRARLAGARIVFLTDIRDQDQEKAKPNELTRERDRSRSSQEQSQTQSR